MALVGPANITRLRGVGAIKGVLDFRFRILVTFLLSGEASLYRTCITYVPLLTVETGIIQQGPDDNKKPKNQST